MENSIQRIKHEEFGEIRVAVIDGVAYSVAIDVARALCFKDTDQAVRQHVQPQDKFTPVKLTGQIKIFGGEKIPPNTILINESGVYSLVLRSKLPKARELQHWLTSEVLPSIARNGYYISPVIAPQKISDEFTRREKYNELKYLIEVTTVDEMRERLIIKAAEILLGEKL